MATYTPSWPKTSNMCACYLPRASARSATSSMVMTACSWRRMGAATVRFLLEPALVAPSHPTAGQLAAFPHLRVTNRSDRQR